jgi:D-alanine-D-alanine ligase
MKVQFPIIIKPCASDASLGISDNSIIQDKNALLKKLARCSRAMKHDLFFEEYVNGREFNVSVISDFNGAPRVLPPAEIIFCNFPKHKPRIVGYKAKWAHGSFEFSNTPRTFDFPSTDRALIQSLKKLSLSCWQVLGLNGYARVDFRIDNQGRPWVLEINGNPCISPDAGLVAAASKAGITYDGLIARIIANLNNA